MSATTAKDDDLVPSANNDPIAHSIESDYPYEDDYNMDEYDLKRERFMMQEREESRLWENDSSYLVAVAPKIFENDRIRLKVILGYRVQALVHGLDNDYAAVRYPTSANSPLVPFNRRQRNRLAQFYNRNEMNLNMTPEQFNELPEYQQRRILRERYLARQWRENRDLRDGLLQTSLQRHRQLSPYYRHGTPLSLGSFVNWAATNINQIGWKSMLGIVAFVLGLYRTIR
jgi:hypothetical protein